MGSSSDQAQLILSNKAKGRRGTHAVEIDQRLLDVLQRAVYARREAQETPQRRFTSRTTPSSVAPPRVAPRELQRQLRAGLSPQHVARASDVDVAYVEQFYPPVLYERAGIVRDAQAGYVEKSRLGRSGLPLGEAVAANLVQRRMRMSGETFTNAWTATRQGSQPWVIAFTFPFRGRNRKATWRFDPRARTIEPINKLAADIGWVPNGDRRRDAVARATALTIASPSSGARRARPRPAPKKRPAKKRTAAKKRPVAKKRAAAKKRPIPKKKRPATKKRPVAKTKRAAAKKRPAARTRRR